MAGTIGELAMKWIMQYRTRRTPAHDWEDWKELPEELLFTNIYAPLCFQFRAAPITPATSLFVFDGTVSNGRW